MTAKYNDIEQFVKDTREEFAKRNPELAPEPLYDNTCAIGWVLPKELRQRMDSLGTDQSITALMGKSDPFTYCTLQRTTEKEMELAEIQDELKQYFGPAIYVDDLQDIQNMHDGSDTYAEFIRKLDDTYAF